MNKIFRLKDKTNKISSLSVKTVQNEPEPLTCDTLKRCFDYFLTFNTQNYKWIHQEYNQLIDRWWKLLVIALRLQLTDGYPVNAVILIIKSRKNLHLHIVCTTRYPKLKHTHFTMTQTTANLHIWEDGTTEKSNILPDKDLNSCSLNICSTRILHLFPTSYRSSISLHSMHQKTQQPSGPALLTWAGMDPVPVPACSVLLRRRL